MQQHATTIVMFGRSDVKACHVAGMLDVLLARHLFWMLMLMSFCWNLRRQYAR